MGCCESADHQSVYQSGTAHAGDAAAAVMEGEGFSTQVELTVHCRGLANLDTFSKSDPMLVVSRLLPDGCQAELGRSEVIMNSNDPNFVKLFLVRYRFEDVQRLRFALYDIDSQFNMTPERITIANQDYIGECECTMAGIMGSLNQTQTLAVTNARFPARAKGTMTIIGEEVAGQEGVVTLRLAARHVDNMDTFSKSDPFVVVSRLREDGKATPVYRSEVVRNNLNPQWAEVKLSLRQLCGGDAHRPLQLRVSDWDRDGSHDFIGSCQLSLDDMVRMAQDGSTVPIVNPVANQRKKGKTNSGLLSVIRCVVEQRPSFLSYIRGGCELDFMVAIDFTGSNGHPLTPGSLHYLDPTGAPNEYELAIRSVGEVLEFYDSDSMFPAFGFGAKIGSTVQHCFPLNGNPSNPELHGVAGILEAYHNVIRQVTLAGPTLFTQVITTAVSMAAAQRVSQQRQRYLVLLILTDGVVNDMANTINAIIGASALPISILIVGVGDADFGNMVHLDGDDALLSLNGRTAQRDIVQFVPLREHVGDIATQAQVSAAARAAASQGLARALLEEIPGQLTSYMASQGILPNRLPPPAAAAAAAGYGGGGEVKTAAAASDPPPPVLPPLYPTPAPRPPLVPAVAAPLVAPPYHHGVPPPIAPATAPPAMAAVMGSNHRHQQQQHQQLTSITPPLPPAYTPAPPAP